MSSPARKYYCDCEAKCKGQRKEVSHTTFYGHKKYRNPLARFTPRFQAFLHGLGPSNAGKSHLSDNAHQRANLSVPGPSNKRSRLSENNFTPLVEYPCTCDKIKSLMLYHCYIGRSAQMCHQIPQMNQMAVLMMTWSHLRDLALLTTFWVIWDLMQGREFHLERLVPNPPNCRIQGRIHLIIQFRPRFRISGTRD